MPPEDGEALAGAIDRLLSDPGLRSAMGNRSTEVFEQRFALDLVVRQMATFYDDILNRR